MSVDLAYAELIRACLEGERVVTRNAECFRRIFWSVTFGSTPLVSARRTPWKTALREWEWFMSGSNVVGHAHPSVRPWWAPWADDRGAVPFNYGRQFRSFYGVNDGIDQIEYLIEGVRDHPYSRRNVITTWNTSDMAQPSCPITNCHHSLTCASVGHDNRLSLLTVQRSADVVVGLPANWIQTWAFLLWLCHRTGRQAGALTWVGHDCHVYAQHEAVARRVLDLAPSCKPTPELSYRASSEDFLADDFTLAGEYAPALEEKVEMVV